MTGLIILVFGATIFYLNVRLRQANETIEELRSRWPTQHGALKPGIYYLNPHLIEQYEHMLEKLNEPGEHYSVGGTKPHMCVCGKPIQEHQ